MKNPYLLLHFAVILAGFTGVFGKLISLNEGLLTWYRLLFTSVFLFFTLKFFKINTGISHKEKLHLAKVGLLLTTHWVLFYASIKYANISIGVVCYSLTSFYTAIFKPLIHKTKFIPSEIALSMLTLLGIALIFHFDTSYQLGIILGCISSALAALYTIYNEPLSKEYNSKLLIYQQMLGGTIGLSLFLPIYLYFSPTAHLVPTASDFIYLLLLSLFCTVGLYIIFAEVLKKIPAFTVNLSFSLEPIYAITLAFLFFDESEKVTTAFYIGLSLMLTSVLLQSLASFKLNKKHTPTP